MENYFLDNDIKLFYIQADSFPNGIKPAFNKLHSLLGSINGRKFFGISYPEGLGKIIYKAAVEENFPGEGEKLGCETFTVKKGEYISEYIQDFMKDITEIGKTFQQMLQDTNIDPKGYCLEMYEGMSNVRCMVPLKS